MGIRSSFSFLALSLIIISGLASAARPLNEGNKDSGNVNAPPDPMSITIGMDWGKGLPFPFGGSVGLGIGLTPNGGLRITIGTGDGIVGGGQPGGSQLPGGEQPGGGQQPGGSEQPGSSGQPGGGQQPGGGEQPGGPSTGRMPNPPTIVFNPPWCTPPSQSSGTPGSGTGNSVAVKSDGDDKKNKSQGSTVHPGEKDDDKKNKAGNKADQADDEGDKKIMSANNENHPALDGDEFENHLGSAESDLVHVDKEEHRKDESGDQAMTP